jgi:hypothetical protein
VLDVEVQRTALRLHERNVARPGSNTNEQPTQL